MGFVKISRRKPIGRIWPPLLWICPFLLVAVVFTLVDSCSVRERAAASESAVDDCEVVGDEHELLITGYCNCGKCCGWRKKWFFFGEPVYNYGKMKGAPKKVGVTASGAVAAKGSSLIKETFANATDADTSLFYYAGHGLDGDSTDNGSIVGVNLD